MDLGMRIGRFRGSRKPWRTLIIVMSAIAAAETGMAAYSWDGHSVPYAIGTVVVTLALCYLAALGIAWLFARQYSIDVHQYGIRGFTLKGRRAHLTWVQINEVVLTDSQPGGSLELRARDGTAPLVIPAKLHRAEAFVAAVNVAVGSDHALSVYLARHAP